MKDLKKELEFINDMDKFLKNLQKTDEIEIIKKEEKEKKDENFPQHQ